MNDPQFAKLVATAIRTAVNAKAAAVAVHALCVAKAKAEGMKPEIEVAIHRPGQDRHHSDNNCWGVCFEAGPYEWAIDASINIGRSRVLAEPYYGFDLSFYDINLTGRPPKYPWRTMEVGEFFFAPNKKSTELQNTARRFHAPKRFKCRKIMLNGVTGIKVLRIE